MTAANRRKSEEPGWYGARWLRRVFTAGTLATIALGVGWAAEPTVPPAIQAALTLRILEYDRSLKSWAGAGLTVGIVTREGGSADATEFRQAISGRDAQGVPLKTVEHAYRDAESLARWIEKDGVRLLYVSSDLGPAAGAILAAAAARKLPTLTLTRRHFQSGGTLAITAQEGKPHIVVDLAASRAAGMDLDPKLLQLAEVIR
jgi:hypothetical protein